MRTSWAAPVAVVLLALTACSGADEGSPGTSGAPAPTGATSASSTTPAPTPAPATPPGSTLPRTTTPRPTPPPSTTPRTTAPSPAWSLPASLRGRVVTRLPTTSRVVALTFDGGAGNQGAASILGTLHAQDVPASFFVTGAFASANPTLVRQMAAIGPVGNHTWSHPDLTAVADAAVREELSSTRTAVLRAGAPDPRPFFRFPFGAWDEHALAVVNGQGYGALGWTADSLGWKGTSGGMTVDAVVDRVLAGRTPGQVVLLHVGANPDDGTTLDAAALPRIIAGYRQAGYGFTTVDLVMGGG